MSRPLPAVLFAVAFAGCTSTPPPMPVSEPFAWNADARWERYEAAFVDARTRGCEAVRPDLDGHLAELDRLVEGLAGLRPAPDDPMLDRVEELVFSAAPLAAVCRGRLAAFQRSFARMRDAVKTVSAGWDMGGRSDRVRLYRLLYGGRAAVEEAMLQGPLTDALPVLPGTAAPRAGVPSAVVEGVTVQSGDLLLSRGGAASSALIARGNDFPGNFSHVALAYVDGTTGAPWVVEAHIEKGVVPAPAATYLADHKLRILVLRPRAGLSALDADPTLPDRAAGTALRTARSRHIPYDFSLDFGDHGRMFCSEVAFAAYEEHGVSLWMGMSTMSAPGLVRWLHSVGVRHFETHEPSDLEYDPQLEVVAEWIDPETLWKDHLDNAATDAMLEGAERGDELDFPVWMVPVAAATKAWSWLLNRFGRIGPVPEGMGPVTALRVRAYTARHASLVEAVRLRSAAYERERGYRPPYWDLVEIARDAMPGTD